MEEIPIDPADRIAQIMDKYQGIVRGRVEIPSE